MGKRNFSAADEKLWAAFSQTITPLPGRRRLPVAAEPVAAVEPAARQLKMPSSPAREVRVDLAPAGLDKSTWKKFSSGRLQAARRLDLHGMTATRAHHAASAFIQHAYAEQMRCIEIITGNGEVLARELPHWLNAPSLRPLILAVAHPHVANTGSVRVLLRRLRSRCDK